MKLTRSPLAPERFPDLAAVRGVELATRAAGLHYRDRPDLMIARVAEGSTVAGTFTKSLCPSAAVDWSRPVVAGGRARAIACNAGNANAFTGTAGASAAEKSAVAVAAALGIEPDEVCLASTGVIGEPLDAERLDAEFRLTAAQLHPADASGWAASADAIRTTDTFPKGAGRAIEGTDAVIVGIAKGSGMIAPDMATMLAFVFTDATVPAPVLDGCLRDCVDRSFNRITVDSDTSTSDTVLAFATGAGDRVDGNDPAPTDAFRSALDAVLVDLAHQIVRDGEGATKFVTVTVQGAVDDHSATIIAKAIANSPLVCTALAAADANWGRIVMAVGKAGQPASRDRLAIWIGDELTAKSGTRAPGYSEERATEHLRGEEVVLRVDVGMGTGTSTVWTCDLTHGYIDINGGYRS